MSRGRKKAARPRLRITADPHQFILNEVSIAGEGAKDAGEERLRPVAHCLNLEHALGAAEQLGLRYAIEDRGIRLDEFDTALEDLRAAARSVVEVDETARAASMDHRTEEPEDDGGLDE